MKGNIEKINLCDTNCQIYLPEKYQSSQECYSVVYLNGEDNIEEIMERVEPYFDKVCRPFILLSIESEDWGRDYTPWAAPALDKKSEPFHGEAANYIEFLTKVIKPFMDENYKTKKESFNTALLGYSLGGLAALYSMYKTEAFGKIGSLSASMWYDGWIEFMKKNHPLNENIKLYISLGKSEEKSRNQRMAKVGNCTRAAFDILKNQLSMEENIILNWNEGGHFTEIPDRFKKALIWLMAE